MWGLGGLFGLGRVCAHCFWAWEWWFCSLGVGVLGVWFCGLGWDKLGSRVGVLGVRARWVVLGHGGLGLGVGVCI